VIFVRYKVILIDRDGCISLKIIGKKNRQNAFLYNEASISINSWKNVPLSSIKEDYSF